MTDAKDEGARLSSSDYAARVGVALLTLPAIEPIDGGRQVHVDIGDVYPNLLEALRSDARVKELDAPTPGKNETSARGFSTAGRSEHAISDARPSMPHQHVHGAAFKYPITMLIQVPKRLQPQSQGLEAIPAEEYWAAWDGVELIVLWSNEDEKKRFGYFGGFAVLDVLEKATDAAGYGLHVQPCGSSCSYPFAHRDLLVSANGNASEATLEEIDEWTAKIVCPSTAEPLRLVRSLSIQFSFCVHIFASMRSHGASVWQTERLARRDLGKLLRLQYESADLRAQPILRSLKSRWKSRSIARDTARLTAGLWLCLATLEENQRGWTEDKYIYEANAARNGFGLVFGVEYPQEVNSVRSLEVSSLRAAVQQMSARADTRLVVLATAGGALAGALVGGLVSLFR